MDKELLKAFDAAKAAADAAAAGDDSPAIDRCLDALRKMRGMPITMKNLVDTQVGKRLRSFKKHPLEEIQTMASGLLDHWKAIVIEETTKSERKNSSSYGDRSSANVEVKSEKSEVVKVERVPNGVLVSKESFHGEIMKVQGIKCEKTPKREGHVMENSNGCKAIKVERTIKEEKSGPSAKKISTPIGPPKLTAMVKCNDPTRDRFREILCEAFSRVSEETSKDSRDEIKNILDEVDACDPIRVAVMVESAMYEKLGSSTGSHKLKYRSIMFNLKDGKNTDFRRKVLLGYFKPESLINITPEEMASDERKLSNKQIKDKALFDCERAGAPKATTDQFKCGRCGQRKTTYYQLQTRSADEPMTTFVTCVNCNNHWKFC